MKPVLEVAGTGFDNRCSMLLQASNIEGVVMTQSPQAAIAESAPPEDVTATTGKLIYVYLTSVREATVAGIADALGLKLIELLPTLRSLQQAGHVERAGDTCRIAS